MKTIFKLIIFSIMLNFAVGVMMYAIPAFTLEDRGGMTYDDTYTDPFVNEMNETINPSGVLEDSGDAIYRVLDMVGLGFIHKIVTAIDTYMFGFINMMQAMFGSAMSEGLRNMLFGAMKVIITIGYILGAWALWTGRSLDD